MSNDPIANAVIQTITDAQLSPIDRALRNQPRGRPQTHVPQRTPLRDHPIDYDPAATKNEIARKALSIIQKTWTTTKHLDDQGINRRELAKSANPALEKACQASDDARAKLIGEKERVEKEIARAIDKGANPAHAPEVRQLVRSLSDMERFKFMNKAVKDGKSSLVSAVLNADAELSGHSDKDLALLRADAELRFAPEAVAIRKELDRNITLVTTAGARLLHHVWHHTMQWEKGGPEDALKALAADE